MQGGQKSLIGKDGNGVGGGVLLLRVGAERCDEERRGSLIVRRRRRKVPADGRGSGVLEEWEEGFGV